MVNIGIIGFGVVGSAVAYGFTSCFEVRAYDKFARGLGELETVVNRSEYLFVCVPTPNRENGKQNLTQLLDAVAAVNGVAETRKHIVIKSTVLPGTTRDFQSRFKKHHFIHNPEFLSQRTAKLDFLNQSRIILGGSKKPVEAIEALYRIRFPATPIFKTTWEGAEAVKYMQNSFSALKIAFCNEMFDVAVKLGVPYEELRNMWLADGRFGNCHHEVPGHDGERGYGGMCFPKDVDAFIEWQRENGLYPFTQRGATETNRRVRKE